MLCSIGEIPAHAWARDYWKQGRSQYASLAEGALRFAISMGGELHPKNSRFAAQHLLDLIVVQQIVSAAIPTMAPPIFRNSGNAPTTKVQKLRELLSRGPEGCVAIVGCHDAISAKLIEQAGFEAIYFSGFAAAARRRPAPVPCFFVARRVTSIRDNLSLQVLTSASSSGSRGMPDLGLATYSEMVSSLLRPLDACRLLSG